jgi:uncharacterized damage-inducible protein DinB
MSTRAETIAAQFEQANQDVIAFVETCDPTTWQKVPAGELRSVGVIAHHIAESYPGVIGFAQMVANGQTLPLLTLDMLNQANAEQAQRYANADPASALALLKSNGGTTASIIRALSDEQLDRQALAFGQTVTTEGLLGYSLIGHLREHLASMQSA